MSMDEYRLLSGIRKYHQPPGLPPRSSSMKQQNAKKESQKSPTEKNESSKKVMSMNIDEAGDVEEILSISKKLS